MCLIEANEPIYPLEILKAMRDQRAMLIQTSVRFRSISVEISVLIQFFSCSFFQNQFRFVLEAIVKVYKEEIVKPLVPIDTEKQ